MAALTRAELRLRISAEQGALHSIGASLQSFAERLGLLERRAKAAKLLTGPPPGTSLNDAEVLKGLGDGFPQIPMQENPLCTGHYWSPLMTQRELDAVSLPLATAPTVLRHILAKYGFAVVTGVLTDNECVDLENKLKQDLLELVDKDAVDGGPQVMQDAYDRFVNEGLSAFPLATSASITQAAGFALDHCLPHGRFAWAVRSHEKVHAAFSAAFGSEEDLVTSQDVPFFTPGGQPASSQCQFSAHVDQNAHDARPGLADCEIYQGVLYVWPVSTSGPSSTTTVLPKSHIQAWPKMMEDQSYQMSGSTGFHYSELAEMQDERSASVLAAAWAAHARRVPVPAGALLLWNSRTMHTGWKGGPRLAQAVCLEPRSRRSTAERLSKMRLAALGLPSVHWASAAMQHDMMLHAPGYLSQEGVPGSAPRGNPPLDAVVLPLRPAIRPVGLADGADLEGLADLVFVDYEYTGMWRAPAEVTELLEASVTEEVKKYL